jgi:hypothetical protein
MNATGQFIPTLFIFPGSKINHRSGLNATADSVAIVERIGRTKTLFLPEFLMAVLTGRQVLSRMVWRKIRQLSYKTA